MDTNDALRTAEQLYAALEADDIPRFLELCAEDVSLRYPGQGRLPYGGLWEARVGVARFMDAHEAAEEILTFEVRRMLAEADTVLVLGDFKGRAKPDGREWSTRFVHHLTITDGLLRHWEAFFDTAAAIDARGP
ncbi:MAG: nuclear transport factor 2 family protein [Chloroflexi bacterium]|nr:nuclear transport factor 2 family protein [Chloroflexota bacterium]